MPSDEQMTIREMCDTYDVTPRALRFYESKELLGPIRIGAKRRSGYVDQYARLLAVRHAETRQKRCGFDRKGKGLQEDRLSETIFA